MNGEIRNWKFEMGNGYFSESLYGAVWLPARTFQTSNYWMGLRIPLDG